MALTDSRERFSARVDDYVRYRPDYPDAAITTLLETVPANAIAADIGSGTGIFTRRLLSRGVEVYAVEPNAAMRAAAEASLGATPGFHSIAGQAEDTGLADASVDLVTAAQAFHWFHNERARAEFRRILRADGRLALIWNKRDQRDAFQQAYHALLQQYAPEYEQVNHMNLDDEALAAFYRDEALRIHGFDNLQRLDLEGLVGRLKSASYCPPQGSDRYQMLVEGIERLLGRYGRDGGIDFVYQTRLYLGRLAR